MEALFGALNALAPWPRIVSICPMSRMNPGTIPARKLLGSRKASVHVRPNHSCLLTFAAGGLIFLSILHLVAAAIQAVTWSSITWRLTFRASSLHPGLPGPPGLHMPTCLSLHPSLCFFLPVCGFLNSAHQPLYLSLICVSHPHTTLLPPPPEVCASVHLSFRLRPLSQ